MRWLAFALGLTGCERVLGLVEVHPPPMDAPSPVDAPKSDLSCATRTALLCADFEQGDTFYADQVQSVLTSPTGNVTAAVDARGADDHAFYVETMGDPYEIDAHSSNPTSRITATFEIELAQLDTKTPVSFVVLYVDQPVAECYVGLDFQPTPMHLTLATNCGTKNQVDLTLTLPAEFVPVTLDMDLTAGSASATLGGNTVTAAISPGATSEQPGIGFGFIDATGSATDKVAFDNVLVVVAP